MDSKDTGVVSCGALPYRVCGGRVQVLLIKQFRHRNVWSFPKGHKLDGETYEACAVREVNEEAGVSVVLGPRLPDSIVPLTDGRTKVVFAWLATVVGRDDPDPTGAASEVADARWFDVEELPNISAYQREAVRVGLTEVQKVHVPDVQRPT